MIKEMWIKRGSIPQDASHSFGFLDVSNKSVKALGTLCDEGLKVGTVTNSLLSNPQKGSVYKIISYYFYQIKSIRLRIISVENYLLFHTFLRKV